MNKILQLNQTLFDLENSTLQLKKFFSKKAFFKFHFPHGEMELDIHTIYEGVYVPTGSASCQVSSGGRRKANLCSSALWAIDRKWAGISEWRKKRNGNKRRDS